MNTNTFKRLLDGDFNGETHEVSLKSTVPIFIAYPEMVIPYKKTISDIVEFYREDEDYNDNSSDLLLRGVASPTPLIVLFTKVFEVILKIFNDHNSELEYIPAISLKIDIGGSASQFEIIKPSKNMVDKFDSSKAKMFTFSGFNAVGKSKELSYEQKHNLLLIDMLTRKYNNSGIGGRR